MKIVILAAGLGSRLREGVTDKPKPLTMLRSGVSIMENQVLSISSNFNIHDVFVVVGYKMNLIMEEFPSLSYVYNPDFSSTNTSKSLLTALHKINTDSVLWFNGDVVFDSKLLEDLKEMILADQSFVCVNNSKVADEEIKYTLDSSGNIKELSKTVKGGLGEAVGINFISSQDLELFKGSLADCEDNDYFERGLEFIIDKGAKIKPLDISSHFCMEVDFQGDLAEVNKAFVGSKP